MKTVFDHTELQDFEKLYVRLRETEGRIYSDQEVACLPSIIETHPHYAEWQLRKESCHRLINYIKKRKKELPARGTEISILEVGCGNGWLSARLSAIEGCNVKGIDINMMELGQAKRVFAKTPNLQFEYGAIGDIAKGIKFDVIVFAASIQYFSSLEKVIRQALEYLTAKGEIHIMDSHFYSIADLGAAEQRSGNYFDSIGFSEMTDLYFHHSLDELNKFDHSILYDPNSKFNRFLRNRNPFYRICIRR